MFSCIYTEKKNPQKNLQNKTKTKKQILVVGFNANIYMQLLPSSSSANAKISGEQIIFEFEIAMILIKKFQIFFKKFKQANFCIQW